jgi:hypothetical protein
MTDYSQATPPPVPSEELGPDVAVPLPTSPVPDYPPDDLPRTAADYPELPEPHASEVRAATPPVAEPEPKGLWAKIRKLFT